jgi:RNA polymerase sigma factor (sigma-70 family)
MMIFLAEPDLTDSELVIGQTPKTAHPETEENRLIEQVRQRAELLRKKRSDFTPAEYRVKLQGEHALTQLLKNNDRLICSLVVKHQNKFGSADPDLKQEAILAFTDATYDFDPSQGAKLSSFAYPRIRSRLQTILGRENRNGIAVARALNESEGYQIETESDSYAHAPLKAAVEQLSECEQEIIALRQGNVPFAEIAERFQRSVKRIQNLYYESLRKLRSILGAFMCDTDPQTKINEPIEPENNEPTEQKNAQVNSVEPSQDIYCEAFRVLFGTHPITNVYRSNRPTTLIQRLENDTARQQTVRLNERIHLFTNGDFMKQTRTSQRIRQQDKGLPNPLSSPNPSCSNAFALNSKYSVHVQIFLLIVGAFVFLVERIDNPSAVAILLAVLWSASKVIALRTRNYIALPPKKEVKNIRFWTTVSSFAAIVLVCMPAVVMAEAAATGGTASCGNLGFLNPIGTLALSTFGNVAGTGGTSITDRACQFVALGLFSFLAGAVFVIGRVVLQLMGDRADASQAFMTTAYSLIFFLGVGVLMALSGIGS